MNLSRSKTANIIILSCLLISVFLLWYGCGQMAPGVSEQKIPPLPADTAKSASAVKIQETETAPDTFIFDPVAIADDSILIPRPAPEKPPEVIKEAEKEVEKWGFEERQGFRVQIFASTVEQSAKEVENKARFEFSENIYLTYEPPNYKVRVGDFVSRVEADLVRQKAISLGYKGAWVVADKIILKVPAKP
jgi:hypothetical protein